MTQPQPPQYPPYPPPDPYNQPTGQPPVFYMNQMAPQPPKKGLPTYGIVLIIIGAFVGLLCAGSIVVSAVDQDSPRPRTAATPDGLGTPAPWTPDPVETTPADVVAQLGDTIVLTSLGDEVHFTLSGPAQKPAKTKFGSKPEKGQFYALPLTAKVIKGGAYIYGGDFALITAAGQPYEGDASLLIEGGLEGVEANAGQTVSGLVVFDIPVGAEKGAKVELREGFGGNQGFWQLP